MDKLEVGQIKQEMLMTLNEYLEAMIEDISMVVNLMREDEVSKSLVYVTDLTEGFQVVFDAINGINDIISPKFDGQVLLDFIKEIVEALENEDYVLLADLLEYEIIDLFKNLKNNIITTLNK